MAQIAKLVIEIPANTVTKKQTEKLDVDIHFTYAGPAQRITFTAVVTQDTWYSDFDEIGSTKKAVYSDIPGSSTPKSWVVASRNERPMVPGPAASEPSTVSRRPA